MPGRHSWKQAGRRRAQGRHYRSPALDRPWISVDVCEREGCGVRRETTEPTVEGGYPRRRYLDAQMRDLGSRAPACPPYPSAQEDP